MWIGENYGIKLDWQQRQIVMAVDRDTGILDLSVFAIPLKGGQTQTIGSGAQDGKTCPKWYGCWRKDCGSRISCSQQNLPPESRRRRQRSAGSTVYEPEIAPA